MKDECNVIESQIMFVKFKTGTIAKIVKIYLFPKAVVPFFKVS